MIKNICICKVTDSLLAECSVQVHTDCAASLGVSKENKLPVSVNIDQTAGSSFPAGSTSAVQILSLLSSYLLAAALLLSLSSLLYVKEF